MRKPVSQRLLPLLLILLTLALDRFTKALAVALPDERTLIPGVLRWIYAENTGMAFSLFSGQSWMLGVVSVIAVIAGWLVLRRYQLSGWSRTAAALMIGGALGNAYAGLCRRYAGYHPVPLRSVQYCGRGARRRHGADGVLHRVPHGRLEENQS